MDAATPHTSISRSVLMTLLGAVGGALLTGAISYISQSKLQKDQELQREVFQKQQADSQGQAELEKVRAQANAAAIEAARTRLANHVAGVQQQMDKLDGKYWTVRLYNGTGTYASVAVSYVALHGLQETSGWTTFQQGQWSENLQDPGAQHGGVENGGFHDSLSLEGSVSG